MGSYNLPADLIRMRSLVIIFSILFASLLFVETEVKAEDIDLEDSDDDGVPDYELYEKDDDDDNDGIPDDEDDDDDGDGVLDEDEDDDDDADDAEDDDLEGDDEL